MVPTYVLWNSTETGQIYTIPKVIADNSPQDPGNYVEHSSLRGRGSIIIDGTDKAPWDLTLRFVLTGDDYEDLIAQIDAVESTIVKNTSYVLKIGRTASTTKDYKVKRLIPIQWDEGRRYNIQYATLTLRVSTW